MEWSGGEEGTKREERKGDKKAIQRKESLSKLRLWRKKDFKSLNAFCVKDT